MNYSQSIRYLLTLGRELASPQQARAAKFDLENITALAEYLGHPERAYPTVHIGGTNGKGSTAAMIASILGAAGLRTGLYTSPHLLRINERLRVDGEDIPDSDFAAAFTRVQGAIEDLLARGALAAHPTFFECLTAMAFIYFVERHVDAAVFEVGMGGRLDSTNIIVPEVAVITQIDFDHENFLGHSIEQIAAEKAGIIKKAAWVVSAADRPAAQQVIRRRAAGQNARMVELDSVWEARELRAEDGCYRFSAAPCTAAPHAAPEVTEDGASDVVENGAEDGLEDAAVVEPDRLATLLPAIDVALPLAGRFQVRNALTAIAAARLLAARGFPVDDAAIVRGLAMVHWPGRLERLVARPAVYLDGTHNPAGARELVHFWDEQFAGRRIHLIYGAMRDKAVDEVAGLLFPRAETVILTQSLQPRSISATALADMTSHLAHNVEVIPEPAAALEHALASAAADDVVFATGSLYLVGDLRKYWNRRDEHFAAGVSAEDHSHHAPSR